MWSHTIGWTARLHDHSLVSFAASSLNVATLDASMLVMLVLTSQSRPKNAPGLRTSTAESTSAISMNVLLLSVLKDSTCIRLGILFIEFLVMPLVVKAVSGVIFLSIRTLVNPASSKDPTPPSSIQTVIATKTLVMSMMAQVEITAMKLSRIATIARTRLWKCQLIMYPPEVPTISTGTDTTK